MKPRPVSARNRQIVEARLAGVSFKEIGKRHGICLGRARQIFLKQSRNLARIVHRTEFLRSLSFPMVAVCEGSGWDAWCALGRQRRDARTLAKNARARIRAEKERRERPPEAARRPAYLYAVPFSRPAMMGIVVFGADKVEGPEREALIAAAFAQAGIDRSRAAG